MRGIRTALNTDQPICDLPITMLVSTHDVKLVDELFSRNIVMMKSGP
jgi:energy-coupling factor transporter ATP-binding protein EcfA2